MPVAGIDQVRGNFKVLMEQTQGEKTERAVTEMLMLGGAYASELTPFDSGELLRSQGRQAQQTAAGWKGVVYYGLRYAPNVNDAPGKLRGLPRAHFGKTRAGVEFGGGSGNGKYWDAMDGTNTAEPNFLVKGMEKMATEAPAILKQIYETN